MWCNAWSGSRTTRASCARKAFLRVHQCLHQYPRRQRLKSWIAQVRIRSPSGISSAGASAGGSGCGRGRVVGRDARRRRLRPGVAAVDGEIAAHLHAAIGHAAALQRTLLTLYHLEEVPIAEISRITGLAEGTIKSHLFRTRKALRAVLEPRIGVAA